jgi:hypothetical protein
MTTTPDNVVGTLQLGRSTSLIFSIQSWKGRTFAQVRKFVSTEKYEGPTKAGLMMGGDVLVAVIEALQRLKAEVPGPKETEFARIPKSRDTTLVVKTIPPDDLKSLPSVDIREFVESPGYTGWTKKGVRFPWDKLSEFVAILESLAKRLGATEKAKPILFPEAKPVWVEQAENAGDPKRAPRDAVLAQLLPDGAKDFPGEFVSDKKGVVVELPTEPIEVAQQSDGKYVVRSSLGFTHHVKNVTEANFIFYAYLRGHRSVRVPAEMFDTFKAVKAYETYVRELRTSLLRAYERKSGHRPMAEHQTREVLNSLGLPWL